MHQESKENDQIMNMYVQEQIEPCLAGFDDRKSLRKVIAESHNLNASVASKISCPHSHQRMSLQDDSRSALVWHAVSFMMVSNSITSLHNIYLLTQGASDTYPHNGNKDYHSSQGSERESSDILPL